MRYRKLKKKLKKGFYASFENCALYFDENISKFWLKGTKLRKKPTRKYTCVVEGGYDSFICETVTWYLFTNKEIKDFIKSKKGLELVYEE